MGGKNTKKWLADEIVSAQETMRKLPEWMKKAARFEGGDHHRVLSEASPRLQHAEKKK